MSKDKVSMPQSMGGLVRYFDEYKSKIEFTPGHIIIMIILVMVIMLFLHAYGNSWLAAP
ncbi:preprotein translocase subunit Sec61beta [Candidatus Woesearchaeota archaeon]|nr:preprotein translocase subunit Sec61beta [Candidatus Woesearchaeota archaeon]HIH38247.1 preprotein translocase subunit Sec61beta [Candidatus Woesearchaeota archaeon]HIH49094.1 preprotein translocase subunit Sec61beta [Candidatus Woesearchaeota archaeon]HIJ04167.1 preprotein translocase subunit Sec61beta [Candidatus Woesearchaeota archaeon]